MIEVKKPATNSILHKRVIFTHLTNADLVGHTQLLIDPVPNKLICPLQFVVYYFNYSDNIDFNIVALDEIQIAGGSWYTILYNNIAADQTAYININPVQTLPGVNQNVGINSALLLMASQVSGGLPTTNLDFDLTIDIYYTLN